MGHQIELQIAVTGAMRLRKATWNPDSFVLQEVLGMPNGAHSYRSQNGFFGRISPISDDAEENTSEGPENDISEDAEDDLFEDPEYEQQLKGAIEEWCGVWNMCSVS